MNELLSAGLWAKLRELAKNAERKHAAIAYATDDRFVKFGKGDVLVTDASDGAIKSGQTSVELLKAAVKREAEVVSIAGLHAKLYVFDKYAIIGSANLSKTSEKLTEVALFTDQPTTVSASRCLIESLKSKGDPVDDEFISRISKLPVTKSFPIPDVGKPILSKDITPRTWLVGVQPLKPDEDEHSLVKKGQKEAERHVSNDDSEVSWIRMRGNSKFRREAKAGDLVIVIWTATAKGRPAAVYRHAPVLTCQEDAIDNCTRFWVEDFPNYEEDALTWKQFRKLFLQVGLSGKFIQWAVREIAPNHSNALHDLWFDQK